MKKKTTLQVRCCYHLKHFGFVLFLGTKDGGGVEGITDGICPACADIEYKKLGIERKKNNEESVQKNQETTRKEAPGPKA
jgi:hypothetical protein